jgi:putative transposase
MQSRIDRELALNALLIAVWRKQPEQAVIAHSDQGKPKPMTCCRFWVAA